MIRTWHPISSSGIHLAFSWLSGYFRIDGYLVPFGFGFSLTFRPGLLAGGSLEANNGGTLRLLPIKPIVHDMSS